MKVPRLVSVPRSTRHTESTGSQVTVAGTANLQCVYVAFQMPSFLIYLSHQDRSWAQNWDKMKPVL